MSEPQAIMGFENNKKTKEFSTQEAFSQQNGAPAPATTIG